MARQTRSDDWGFPRWRSYGGKREAANIRLCDRHGCTAPGDRPAPKSPNSRDRWWFCETHAAEYNKGWNYFEGLTKEQAAERERAERGDTAFEQARHWGWAGAGDGTRTRGEMDALAVLGLESDADFETVRATYRALAKRHHPDRNAGNAEAAATFQAVQAAYEVLRRADEAKSWKGAAASP
jgi:DnaJ domain